MQPMAKIMESPRLEDVHQDIFYLIANKQITDMIQKMFCSIA